MFLRIFRPLTAPLASLASSASTPRALPVFSTFPVESTLPVLRPRTFATSTLETTDAAAANTTEPPPPPPPQQQQQQEEEAQIPQGESVVIDNAAASSPSPSSPDATVSVTPDAATVNLPYFVDRNSLDNFGVYQKTKSGGNKKVTLVKRGQGNLQALRCDLRDALQLDDSQLYINHVTKHVVVKGHKRDQVVHFLRTMGF